MRSKKMYMVLSGLFLQLLIIAIDSCSNKFNEISLVTNYVCSKDILWEERVISIVACILKCQNDDQCTGVFYEGSTGKCKATSFFYTDGPNADCQQSNGWKYLVPDADCEKWKGTYVVIPGYRIYLNNVATNLLFNTQTDCEEQCLQMSNCRSVDFRAGACWYNGPSALSKPEAFNAHSPSTYLHKSCECTIV